MKVIVTRDSVAAGDDFNAPHIISFHVKDDLRLKDVFKHLAQVQYLPTVAGRGHSWQAVINERIAADFVANKRQPKFSMLLFSPITDFVIDEDFHINFRYKSARH